MYLWHRKYRILHLKIALPLRFVHVGQSISLVSLDTNLRQHFFSERVINLWNVLPNQIVDAPNTTLFKNRLHRHWKIHQYTLDTIPATPATFSIEYEEDEE